MRFLLVSIAVLGCATSALAQSSDVKPFNGPYLGAQGGLQIDRGSISVDDGFGPVSGSKSHSGFLYGGQIGIDQQIAARVVFGVEGSITGDTGSATISDGEGDSASASFGRTFNVTGRVGYLINPRGLFYARGGWTNAQFDLSALGQSGSFTRSGYLVGAGYEYALSRHVSARLEYGYSHFSKSLDLNVSDTAYTVHVADDRHAVTLGVNYRF